MAWQHEWAGESTDNFDKANVNFRSQATTFHQAYNRPVNGTLHNGVYNKTALDNTDGTRWNSNNNSARTNSRFGYENNVEVEAAVCCLLTSIDCVLGNSFFKEFSMLHDIIMQLKDETAGSQSALAPRSDNAGYKRITRRRHDNSTGWANGR